MVPGRGGAAVGDPTDFDRRVPRDRALRAADRDRDAVAAILAREHVAGRLDDGEYDERVTRCLGARTYGELDALLADLLPLEPEEPVVARGRRVVCGWPFPAVLLIPLLAVAIVASHGHLLWLAFPVVFLLVVRPRLWSRACGRESGVT
ncbi:MAG TPA: DUF1707 domain-containing protein [Miltoncostaea sp.]|nr:DUF1707 domain-containing protein [Miltoncostaea sp.]